MGKFLSIIGGLIALFLGIIGLVAWWDVFVRALMATIPAILIIGGLIAFIGGINELKESAGSKKKEEPAKEEPAKEEPPK